MIEARWRWMFYALGAVSTAALIGVAYWVFRWTPLERYMGFSQKIMYVHVPSIYVAYLAFFTVFLCSVHYLWKQQPFADRMARSAAEIGVLFCGAGLISGAIWGKPTWGTYWVWDARLTTTLILLCIYSGYILLRISGNFNRKQAKIAAVLGVIGFLDIPLVHVSVRWWRTLHQPSTLFKVNLEGRSAPSIPAELFWPLIAALLSMTLLYFFLLWWRILLQAQQEKLSIHQRTLIT